MSATTFDLTPQAGDMVVSRSDVKKRRKEGNILEEPLQTSPKRTKVHAQRKFAQGSSNMSSPALTPVKDKDKVKTNGTALSPELIPTKRPKTEDFLTFLCFRGTPILPPCLDFFNIAAVQEPVDEEQGDCGRDNRLQRASDTSAGGGVMRADSVSRRKPPTAVQALKRKYQEQRLAKQRASNLKNLAQRMKGKSVVRTRSASHSEGRRVSTRTRSSVVKKTLRRVKMRPTGKPHLLNRNKAVLKKRARTCIRRDGLRSGGQLPPGSDVGLKSERFKKKIVAEKVTNKMFVSSVSDFSSDDDQPLAKKMKPMERASSSRQFARKVIKRIVTKRIKSRMVTRSQQQEKEKEPAEARTYTRPPRKTKEAAAIYMEMLGRKLITPEAEVDEDSLSIDSFPELPNVKRIERRESELKAKASREKREAELSRETTTVQKSKPVVENGPVKQKRIEIVKVNKLAVQRKKIKLQKQQAGKNLEGDSRPRKPEEESESPCPDSGKMRPPTVPRRSLRRGSREAPQAEAPPGRSLKSQSLSPPPQTRQLRKSSRTPERSMSEDRFSDSDEEPLGKLALKQSNIKKSIEEAAPNKRLSRRDSMATGDKKDSFSPLRKPSGDKKTTKKEALQSVGKISVEKKTIKRGALSPTRKIRDSLSPVGKISDEKKTIKTDNVSPTRKISDEKKSVKMDGLSPTRKLPDEKKLVRTDSVSTTRKVSDETKTVKTDSVSPTINVSNEKKSVRMDSLLPVRKTAVGLATARKVSDEKKALKTDSVSITNKISDENKSVKIDSLSPTRKIPDENKTVKTDNGSATRKISDEKKTVKTDNVSPTRRISDEKKNTKLDSVSPTPKISDEKKSVKVDSFSPIRKISDEKKSVKVDSLSPIRKISDEKKSVKVDSSSPIRKIYDEKKTVKVDSLSPISKISDEKKMVKTDSVSPTRRISDEKKTVKLDNVSPIAKVSDEKKSVKTDSSLPTRKISDEKRTVKRDNLSPVEKISDEKKTVKIDSISVKKISNEKKAVKIDSISIRKITDEKKAVKTDNLSPVRKISDEKKTVKTDNVLNVETASDERKIVQRDSLGKMSEVKKAPKKDVTGKAHDEGKVKVLEDKKKSIVTIKPERILRIPLVATNKCMDVGKARGGKESDEASSLKNEEEHIDSRSMRSREAVKMKTEEEEKRESPRRTRDSALVKNKDAAQKKPEEVSSRCKVKRSEDVTKKEETNGKEATTKMNEERNLRRESSTKKCEETGVEKKDSSETVKKSEDEDLKKNDDANTKKEGTVQKCAHDTTGKKKEAPCSKLPNKDTGKQPQDDANEKSDASEKPGRKSEAGFPSALDLKSRLSIVSVKVEELVKGKSSETLVPSKGKTNAKKECLVDNKEEKDKVKNKKGGVEVTDTNHGNKLEIKVPDLSDSEDDIVLKKLAKPEQSKVKDTAAKEECSKLENNNSSQLEKTNLTLSQELSFREKSKSKVNMSNEQIEKWLNESCVDEMETKRDCQMYENDLHSVYARPAAEPVYKNPHPAVDSGKMSVSCKNKKDSNLEQFRISSTIKTVENKDIGTPVTRNQKVRDSETKKAEGLMKEGNLGEARRKSEIQENVAASKPSIEAKKQEVKTQVLPDRTAEKKSIFQQRRPFPHKVKERKDLTPSANAFSPENESSVYAFDSEPEMPVINPPFRRRARDSRTSSTATSKSEEDLARLDDEITPPPSVLISSTRSSPVTQSVLPRSPAASSHAQTLLSMQTAPVSQSLPVSQSVVSQSLPVSQSFVSQSVSVSQSIVSQSLPVSQSIVSESLPVVSQSVAIQSLPISQAVVSQSAPVSQSIVSQSLPVSHSVVSQNLPVVSQSLPISQSMVNESLPVLSQSVPVSESVASQSLPISQSVPVSQSLPVIGQPLQSLPLATAVVQIIPTLPITMRSMPVSTQLEQQQQQVLLLQNDAVMTTLKSGSTSIAVQVNLDNEASSDTAVQSASLPEPSTPEQKSMECWTQTDVTEEEEDDSEGHLFYIPLQQPPGPVTAPAQQLIQGVAVKLGTEGPTGPNQRVIMRAKLVTKPPNFNRAQEGVIARSVVTTQQQRPGGMMSSASSPPVGTVQPTARGRPLVTTRSDATTDTMQKPPDIPDASLKKPLAMVPAKPMPTKTQSPAQHARERRGSSDAASPSTSTSKASTSTSKRSCQKQKTSYVCAPSNATSFPGLGSPAQMVEAPIFHPTEKEFQDPLEYIDRIRPVAEKFGLCRVVPPPNFKPECKVSDDMRFLAYNQYVNKMLHRWGPNVKEMMAIKKYLATQSISFTHPPWIGGMEVDLPRLYKIVQGLGGLKEVIEKKKWQRVADAMKIPKSAQDRVTKLDDIYCKYLLPYDTLSPDERQKLFDEVEKEWLEREKRMSASSADDDCDADENEECIVKGRNMPLNAFYRIARNTMSMWFRQAEPPAAEVEQEFWRHVTLRQSHVCVHSGSIDSSGWGYGFPVSKNSPFARHPWNLKVLTNNSGSILRSIGPIMGVTVPTLHVGMVFTTCCWYRDPHGLPWVEYLHTGASKIWYGIPDEYSSVFRSALTKLVPKYVRNKTIWLPSDTAMVPPPMLVKHGVSLCHTVQEPGQFILVFPRAFTSSICTGYLVSESVYFAQPSWLSSAEQVFKDIRDSCEPSMFSLERLLFSVATDGRTNVEVLKQILPMVVEMRQQELDYRKQLYTLGLKTSERLPLPEANLKRRKARQAREEEGDYECEMCRANLFVSLVTNSHEEGVYCLPHAVELLTKKRHHLKYCKLMYTYDQAELNELIQKLQERIEAKSHRKSQGKVSLQKP